MTPEATREAATLLLAARRARRAIERLPQACRPNSAAEGYAIQAAFARSAAELPNLDPAGTAPAGYKIGATSRRAQEALGVDEPFVGRIFAGGVHESPAEVEAGDFIFRLIEPEFAFRLGAPLPPRPEPYGEAEVAEAVAALHPAFEIISSAFGAAWTEVGAPSLTADNGCHGAFVLGPECRDWRGLDLPGHAVKLSVNGAPAGEGRGANALGGPLTALTWLVNALGGVEDAPPLGPGDIVTTGVVTEFVLLEAGDEAVADFGDLGEVRVRFTA